MTRKRLDGLYLVLFGAVIFVLVGAALENAAPVSTADFRVMYFSARCFLHHCDPYNVDRLKQVYRLEGEETAADTPTIVLTETQYIYPPTAFSITAPFALLPFYPAHIAWLLVTAVTFIIAAYLIWDVSAHYSPVMSGALVCLFLANSELFLILGNPAGIAISCCVIAVVCFLRERFVALGVLCLAVSLMLKPHDSGLVWLYFALLGGAHRKRALQVVAVAAFFSAPSFLWIAHTSPSWIHEIGLNLAANSASGGLSDPGPNSLAAHGIGMLVSLQAVLSLIRDVPSFYNPVSYMVCGLMLVIWLIKTVQIRFSVTNAWFALAPIAAITMLPIYHRIYDTRLLLLLVPACAMLWARGGILAWFALTLSAVTACITGGIPWAIFLALFPHLPAWMNRGFTGLAIQMFPVPLMLLTIGVFYLWIYVQMSRVDENFAAIGGSSD
jgi:hypothetical protein